MKQYEIIFYNRFGCQTQKFYVIAKDKEDAERLFWLMYDKQIYHDDCIEYISEYRGVHFYTEEEILARISK